MASFLHGVHVPHFKNTAKIAAVRMPTPHTVTIPMSMHIGAPAKPVVKVGDIVKVGTLIAEAGGFVSAPIYSSVAGKVTKITDYLLSSGGTVPAVIIEADAALYEQANASPEEGAAADAAPVSIYDESVIPPVVDSRESLLAAIQKSGIVGLGGAGFPTHVKFNVEPERIEYLIINGAECEPFVTSDTRTMLDRTEDMAVALEAFKTYLGIRHIIIGIEKNKKSAIKSMKKLMKETCEGCTCTVKVLPAVYPQGGEKVMIYHTTGRKVPVGKLPIDVGCIVINVTTLAAIGAYLQTGLPLVEKCVTVDGGAVKEPKNVIAPIGTPIADLLEFCGGLKTEPDRVVYGGPMMGITVPDTTAPVLKNTNAVLALTAKETKTPVTTACIRCGSCTNACPFGLAPAAIAKAYEQKDAVKLEELSVNACMECGCCSFVCPANRPLVQTNKLSKILIREEKAKEGTKS